MVDLSKHSTATGIRGTFNDAKLKAIVANMDELDEYETQVGYYNQRTYDDGTLVSAVAAFHEFGTANMPQRSFIRATLEEEREAIQKVTAEAMNDLLVKGKPARQCAAKIARTIGGLVYRRLMRSAEWAEPLAESTVKAKGHDTPLYDEGRLRDDLMWRVRRKGAIVAQGHCKNVSV